jgi:hypothetical protein
VASHTRPSELARLSGVDLAARLAPEVGVKRGGRLALGLVAVASGGAQIDPGLRAGLVYAGWCKQVTLTG